MTLRRRYLLLGAAALLSGAALVVLGLEDHGGFVTPGSIALMVGSLAGILLLLVGGVLSLRGRGTYVLIVGGTILVVTWGSLLISARIQERQVEDAKVVGATLAAAIERHVTDRGAPPDHLVDLVPEYVESVPRCPLGFWGREYRYFVHENQFRLWFSVSFGSQHFWDSATHRWKYLD